MEAAAPDSSFPNSKGLAKDNNIFITSSSQHRVSWHFFICICTWREHINMYGLRTLAAAGLAALACAQDALHVPAELTSFEPGTGTRSLWVGYGGTRDDKMQEY